MKNYTSIELQNHKDGQKIMTNMLKIVNNICQENNIQYWCIGGTLIGTLRHKGWIPHDGDIDIAMLDSDYLIFREIIQQQLPDRYWFQDSSSDVNFDLPFITKIRYLDAIYCDDKCKKWHNGLQLDIFVYTKDKDLLLPPPYIDYELKPIKSDMIFPLKTLQFEGINVLVPNEYEKYSCDIWGSYTPPELDETQQYPSEGRISFKVPNWMKKKYKHLYLQ